MHYSHFCEIYQCRLIRSSSFLVAIQVTIRKREKSDSFDLNFPRSIYYHHYKEANGIFASEYLWQRYDQAHWFILMTSNGLVGADAHSEYMTTPTQLTTSSVTEKMK